MRSPDPKQIQVADMTKDIRHHYRKYLDSRLQEKTLRATEHLVDARDIAKRLLEMLEAELEFYKANPYS